MSHEPAASPYEIAVGREVVVRVLAPDPPILITPVVCGKNDFRRVGVGQSGEIGTREGIGKPGDRVGSLRILSSELSTR